MTEREKEIIEGVIKVIEKHCDPLKIFLFGSRAKESNQDHADFDFAVDGTRPIVDIVRQMNEEIEGISGLFQVDVVFMECMDDAFKQIIQKTGKVIYERRT